MIYEQFLKDLNTKNDSIISNYTSWHHYVWKDSPDWLAYFIGYRIVQAYVDKYGQDSWKQLYDLPVKEIFARCDYDKFIIKNK